MYRSCDTTNWVFSLPPHSIYLSVYLFPNRNIECAFIALDCHTIYRLVKCDLMPSWIVNFPSSIWFGGATQKKVVRYQIVPAVAQIWFMVGDFFLLLVWSNWNLCKCQCFNKFFVCSKLNHIILDLFWNLRVNAIYHYDNKK